MHTTLITNTAITNTAINNAAASTRHRRPSTRPRPEAAPAEASSPRSPIAVVGKRPASEITRLVFFVVLALSAVVAVIGVVDQASDTTSPDAPAPAVIIEVD